MPPEEKKRPGFFRRLFGSIERPNPRAVAAPDSVVIPDPIRCVQCGVCGYNCPVGIPVRDYARQGKIVDCPECIQCGQCIEACPRGTLRWGKRPSLSALGHGTTDYGAVISPLAVTTAGQRERNT